MKAAEVALYTSAWIEIMYDGSGSFTDYVALYTSAWIEIVCGFRSKKRPRVALYTSAWIEIANGAYTWNSYGGRTLHECVD